MIFPKQRTFEVNEYFNIRGFFSKNDNKTGQKEILYLIHPVLRALGSLTVIRNARRNCGKSRVHTNQSEHTKYLWHLIKPLTFNCSFRGLTEIYDNKTTTLIHLIQKMFSSISSELLHCALLHTQTATHHGCNEFLNSIAGTYYETTTFVCYPWKQCGPQCFAVLACNSVQIRYIHGALQSGYATMRNAQCNNSENNLFWIRSI